MFYALYFGTLGRDFVDRLSDKMATTMGYYSKSGFPRKHLRENMCAICGTTTRGSNEKLHQLNCQHTYHEVCIRGWAIVGKKDVCPYCKEKVDLNDFKQNSWDTTQVLYLNLLDILRYVLVWNPIVFFLVHFLIDFLGLK
jgi:RING finger protein 121